MKETNQHLQKLISRNNHGIHWVWFVIDLTWFLWKLWRARSGLISDPGTQTSGTHPKWVFQNKRSGVIRQESGGLCACGSDVSLFACASWRTRPWKQRKQETQRKKKNKWDAFESECKALETADTQPRNRRRWRQWQTTEREEYPSRDVNVSTLLSSDASSQTSEVFSGFSPSLDSFSAVEGKLHKISHPIFN